jgi:hypothetical protein
MSSDLPTVVIGGKGRRDSRLICKCNQPLEGFSDQMTKEIKTNVFAPKYVLSLC